MSSRWILNRLQESIARIILRQHQEDEHPGSDFAQEQSSDVTFAEAACVHTTLEAYADEIEKRLAELRVDVVLASLADKKRDGEK